ncbi:MAG TPA: hypothetical protein VK013_07710 [Myxococcaceae bacterium]|nr:hypothetical protein [Myxococcaceae bacterium]
MTEASQGGDVSIRGKVKKQVLEVGNRAVEAFMADERRAMAVAEAVGRAQKGKQSLEQGQEELLRAMQFATRGDYAQVGKQLAGLKRRLRAIEKQLDARLRDAKG